VDVEAQQVHTPPGRFAAVRPGVSKQARIDLHGYAFAIPFLIVYGLFTLWPIISGLRMSFSNVSLLGGSSPFVGFQNYSQALHDPDFWAALWHSVEFTIITTPPLVVFGLALALLANRAMPGRSLFRMAIFAPFVLPVTVVTLVWVWLYEPGFGLINGYLAQLHLPTFGWLTDTRTAMPAVAITTIWWTLGFNFLVYLAGLQAIPREFYEASAVDGANAWDQLRHVTIPLLKRTTVIVLILQVLASLKVFGQIYAMTGGGPDFSTRSEVEYVYEQGFTAYHLGYAAAMSFLFFIVLLAVSAFQFRLFARRR
jgi:multiple sugar transport system permease protein